MNWGKWITVSFFLFGGLMITLITISMNQNIDLVAKDYYEQEINYQDRIDQMHNTASLKFKPELVVAKGDLIISFDANEMADFKSGTLTLFSPVNKDEDKVFILDAENFPNYGVEVSTLRKGLWKIMLEWNDGHKTYYQEQQISF